jgi:orotidine-5'-phosphate decarboxylase
MGAGSPDEVAPRVSAFYRAVLAGAHEHVACVKLQSAFFEVLGVPGLAALEALLGEARSLGLPTILDGKRGDIGSTAEAYAEAYLGAGPLAADALTVSPYLGFDTLEPFEAAAERRGRGLFVLVATSNPGAPSLQDLVTSDGRLLHEHVADAVAAAATRSIGPSGYGAVGAVVGATRPERLAALRRRLPHSLLLVPGFGAQGATADDVVTAFDRDGGGAVVSSSRELVPGPDARDLAAVTREAGARAAAARAALERALAARAG